MADFQIPDKTLLTAVDRAADSWLVYDNSATALKRTTVNYALDLTSHPVGVDDTQTLTAKTLTSPTINGATLSGTLTGTYTIGGTPTFPSSVVTLTGSQTLTNKVLTSPTINNATVANPTLTVDTVSEYTTANGVTIDSLNIKDGKLNTNDSVVTANITNKAVTEEKISDGWVHGSDGWIDSTQTWAYVSATSFKITGTDVTAQFPVGTKIKLTQTTAKYFYVTAATFSTDTTVTVASPTYTVANAAITSPMYSYMETPQGYASGNPYRFRAYRNAAANAGTSGTLAKITFDTENFDYNNNFASGTYTAPLAGTYHFDWRAKWITGGAEQYQSALYKNGAMVSQGTNTTAGGVAHVTTHGSDTIELAANDTVDVYCANSAAGAKALETGSTATYFAGYLVSRT